jgi:hypothetical protein
VAADAVVAIPVFAAGSFVSGCDDVLILIGKTVVHNVGTTDAFENSEAGFDGTNGLKVMFIFINGLAAVVDAAVLSDFVDDAPVCVCCFGSDVGVKLYIPLSSIYE